MKGILLAVGAVVIIAVSVVALRGQAIPVEIVAPVIMDVRQYIVEDGKTSLAHVYVVDMPVSGTVQRLGLEVGDTVEKGEVVAAIDTYALKQRIRELQSLIERTRASVTGVDMAKPKDEDIESALIHVTEMRDGLAIAKRVHASLAIQLDDAKKDFDRAVALVDDKVVSQSFYDEAETKFKTLSEDVRRGELQEQAAQKALNVAELAHRRLTASVDDNEYRRAEHEAQIEAFGAQVAVLKNDLGKTNVEAPVSGPVLEKYVEDRRVLAAGSPLLRIGDLDSIEIECDVLSEEVSRVKEGDPVEIAGKVLMGATAMGRVKRIYPSGFMKVSALGVEQQRVRTLIEFDNSALGLRPGTSVDLSIVTAQSPGALAVPERAAFRREGAWHVFAVDGDVARLQPVEIGLKNNDWAEIVGGLDSGDTIIADPKNELEDGARVTPLE
ncbi:MAG: efflux RND transporter periplasmic adaptor subunit [Candidatus Hydrogenedentes bacterium]|jgi:HlyD family secretion protein|nr:efflux RND transporter periplasmic adaptor subunit [Candidatus Hydrogenedentota bacterium]